jgi:amino acid adenylation domain-containing protein
MAPSIPLAAFDRRVDALIVEQAARTPEATAVVFRGAAWTYRDLVARADAVAALLAERGVVRGDIVGLHMNRSSGMLAAMIAVWRAGAAYLPLDPAFPKERLTLMAADSGTRIILCTDGGPRFEASGAAWLSIESAPGTGDRGPGVARDLVVESRVPSPQSRDLAYLLYTSGSTGRPKGVAVEHRSVVNFLLSMAEEPGLRAADRLLAVTTISFDIAGLELFLPLIVGATVVIAEEADALDGERLKSLLARHDVTAMQATPTGWRVLLDAGWQGSPGFKALVGGEALPQDVADALAARAGSVWNMYGPTETTIWSAVARVRAGAPVLIGRPIANTGIYVLDRRGNPQPPGVVGEICIGGAGVARGYWNRDDLTAERFVSDPFLREFGGRMYRTGDQGRLLKSGELEFRGRADAQVKVRGFRVELGEIEAALAGAPGVRAAAAKAVTDDNGDARIIAYVEADAIDEALLRERLRAKLPHYMIPQAIVALDEFPLTPNGKVDRNRLPDAARPQINGAHYVAPSGDTELLVARAFGEVLNAEKVSAEANFFDLGGHSILAIRALAILRRDIYPDLDLAAVFEASHVRDLARIIDEKRRGAPASRVYEF